MPKGQMTNCQIQGVVEVAMNRYGDVLVGGEDLRNLVFEGLGGRAVMPDDSWSGLHAACIVNITIQPVTLLVNGKTIAELEAAKAKAEAEAAAAAAADTGPAVDEEGQN